MHLYILENALDNLDNCLTDHGGKCHVSSTSSTIKRNSSEPQNLTISDCCTALTGSFHPPSVVIHFSCAHSGSPPREDYMEDPRRLMPQVGAWLATPLWFSLHPFCLYDFTHVPKTLGHTAIGHDCWHRFQEFLHILIFQIHGPYAPWVPSFHSAKIYLHQKTPSQGSSSYIGSTRCSQWIQ